MHSDGEDDNYEDSDWSDEDDWSVQPRSIYIICFPSSTFVCICLFDKTIKWPKGYWQNYLVLEFTLCQMNSVSFINPCFFPFANVLYPPQDLLPGNKCGFLILEYYFGPPTNCMPTYIVMFIGNNSIKFFGMHEILKDDKCKIITSSSQLCVCVKLP